MGLEEKLEAKNECTPLDATDTLVFQGDVYQFTRRYFTNGLNRLPILVYSKDSGGTIHASNGHNTRAKHVAPGEGESELQIDGLTDRGHVSLSKVR